MSPQWDTAPESIIDRVGSLIVSPPWLPFLRVLFARVPVIDVVVPDDIVFIQIGP